MESWEGGGTGEGCWRGKRAHGLCPQRYMPVMTCTPRVIMFSYTQLHMHMVTDSEMLVKHLISLCVRTDTHTQTLCKMSWPLNCLGFLLSFP